MIHPNPDIADIPEAYIPDEDVVDAMGDDMLEAMELKNVKICDYSYFFCGRRHEMDDYTSSLYDSFEKNTRDK